jgi:hypothetical protein
VVVVNLVRHTSTRMERTFAGGGPQVNFRSHTDDPTTDHRGSYPPPIYSAIRIKPFLRIVPNVVDLMPVALLRTTATVAGNSLNTCSTRL